MNRLTLIAIAVASGLLTPLVVNAASRMEPGVIAAATPTAAAAVLANLPGFEPCTRRVRVVHAAAYQVPSSDCAAPTYPKGAGR